MATNPLIWRLLLLIGLDSSWVLHTKTFTRAHLKRPWGIRSFPLLSLIGALLYRLDPVRLVRSASDSSR